MVIDKKILNELTDKAKSSPRLRCNLDLRNSTCDQSQRMLNALEPGTVMPIKAGGQVNGISNLIPQNFQWQGDRSMASQT